MVKQTVAEYYSLREKELINKMTDLGVVSENKAWNAAIEAAALIVQPNPHVSEERRCEDIAVAIRRLKK